MLEALESNVLYGLHNNTRNKRAPNVTFRIAKFYIFLTSSCNGNLCFEGFLVRLQEKLVILKQNAIPLKERCIEHLGKVTFSCHSLLL